MKKKTAVIDDDPLDREVDLTQTPVRGKYARDFYKSKNLRILAPDLLALFPDSESVNETLRAVAAIAARIVKPPDAVSAKRVPAPKRERKRSTKK